MARKFIANNRYLRDIADDAWRVILWVSIEPDMYLRGLEVVELRPDAIGRIAVVTLTRDALRDTLDRLPDFVLERQGQNRKKMWRPSSPPLSVVNQMWLTPTFRFLY